jgi:septum formation protein
VRALQRLVLASGSPRRAALLGQAGVVPDEIIAPDIDETVQRNERPREYALRIAETKAKAVAAAQADAFVLAADTVVACGRRILPKAGTGEDVKRCLKLLSGRRHRVYTAIAVDAPDTTLRTRVVVTSVMFKRVSGDEVARYLDSGEGIGKAGGYAVQGLAETFVRQINGSYSNIVGLPLSQTISLLGSSGYRVF